MLKRGLLVLVVFLVGCTPLLSEQEVQDLSEDEFDIALEAEAVTGKALTATISKAMPLKCKDSDGQNDTVAGNVTQYFMLGGRRGVKLFSDECTDDRTVKEYYCDGKIVRNKLMTCHLGCVERACEREAESSKFFLRVGDIVDLQGGLKAELDGASSNRLLFLLFYERDGQIIYFPQPFRFLPRIADSLGNGPFISVGGGYLYYEEFIEENSEAVVEVFDSCVDLYFKCLSDSNVNDEFCESNACFYESFHENYRKMDLGDFSIIYPQDKDFAAQQIMEYLPACYNAIENIFGERQSINHFYFYLQEGAEGYAYATADRITLTWYDYMAEQFVFENPDDPCGVGFFPMGHEMVHVHDFGTWNTPLLREGFANYISRRVTTFDNELICEEDGYYRRDPITGEREPLQPYPTTKEEFDLDSYNTGECYFRLLENRYGIETVDELIQLLGSTRNIEKENINFFTDAILPIFGEDAVNLAESMGIDITCNYDIPFTGWDCAES